MKVSDKMKYFFAGIKGSGMSALATMLYDMGNEIIGYDDSATRSFTEDELDKRHIKIYIGDESKLSNDMILVYTSAIHDDHKVVQRATKLGIKKYEYFEMVGELTKKYETISICGCHGKTTTTALLSKILCDTIGTNYLIGDGMGEVDPKSSYFVLESCEYKRHFLAYYPAYIIVTNIELDHVDYYKDMDDMFDAYQTFIQRATKKVIACGDDAYNRKLVSDKLIYYGINDDNDVVAKNLIQDDKGSSFDVYINQAYYDHFVLPLFGKHMVLNALACITMGYLLQLDKEAIMNSIKTFKGAKRRFKEIMIDDNVLIDDYAHHPTEMRVTLEAAHQKYPHKTLIAVAKMHTLSRVKALWPDFVKALDLASKTYIMDIYNDREDPNDYPGVDANLLIKHLRNGEHIHEGEANKLLPYHNAVICFLSSKDIDVLMNEYIKLKKEE